jgi:hypothetical protein
LSNVSGNGRNVLAARKETGQCTIAVDMAVDAVRMPIGLVVGTGTHCAGDEEMKSQVDNFGSTGELGGRILLDDKTEDKLIRKGKKKGPL